MDGHVSPFVLDLPAAALQNAQSFAIDFGGSVLKIIYKPKDEPENEGKIRLRMASFSRQEFPIALEFIRENCQLPTAEEGEQSVYYLTGIGTHEFQKTMEKELNIRVQTLWEGFCFIKALLYLMKNLPEEELYFPALAEADAQTEELMEKFKKLMPEMGMETAREAETPSGSSEDVPQFPCITVTLGSAFVFAVVNEDGKLGRSLMTPRGGRMFLGLGSLLTNAKTYEELQELASRGNDRTVNSYTNDLTKNAETLAEDDRGSAAYKAMDMDLNVFSFGWAVSKSLSDFKREDLARALLQNVCDDIAQQALCFSMANQVKNIILVGGFPQSPLAREIIEARFVEQRAGMCVMEPQMGYGNATLRTLKAGSHLGALGAMLHK